MAQILLKEDYIIGSKAPICLVSAVVAVHRGEITYSWNLVEYIHLERLLKDRKPLALAENHLEEAFRRAGSGDEQGTYRHSEAWEGMERDFPKDPDTTTERLLKPKKPQTIEELKIRFLSFLRESTNLVKKQVCQHTVCFSSFLTLSFLFFKLYVTLVWDQLKLNQNWKGFVCFFSPFKKIMRMIHS